MLEFIYYYFTTPGNALAPQTQGKETGAVADSGHVRVWTKGKYIRVQDAPDHGKTVGPAGGDAAADGYHPTLPESWGFKEMKDESNYTMINNK